MNNIYHDFMNACYTGHLNECNVFLELCSKNDINIGLYYACKGANLEIVKLLISRGADNFNGGLRYVCDGGYMEIAKLEIAKFMIEKGADNFKVLKNIKQDLELYKLYIRKTGKCDKDKLKKLVIKHDPLYTIITHYDKNKHIRKLPVELWRMTKDFL